MMTSDPHTREAFVWIWLPGETQPVVAGKLEADNGIIHFNGSRNACIFWFGLQKRDRLIHKALFQFHVAVHQQQIIPFTIQIT